MLRLRVLWFAIFRPYLELLRDISNICRVSKYQVCLTKDCHKKQNIIFHPLKRLVFCFQNCSDLLSEKNVLVMEKNIWDLRLKTENLQNILRTVFVKVLKRRSLSADLCIHSYWLNRLRQASHRKMIQSSALRLRLWCFKILTSPLLQITRIIFPNIERSVQSLKQNLFLEFCENLIHYNSNWKKMTGV